MLAKMRLKTCVICNGDYQVKKYKIDMKGENSKCFIFVIN